MTLPIISELPQINRCRLLFRVIASKRADRHDVSNYKGAPFFGSQHPRLPGLVAHGIKTDLHAVARMVSVWFMTVDYVTYEELAAMMNGDDEA